MLSLDGVYRFGSAKARFHRARRPTRTEIAHLLGTLSRRIVVVLERRGLLVAPQLEHLRDALGISHSDAEALERDLRQAAIP